MLQGWLELTNYEFVFLNAGQSIWRKHFSADEEGIYETNLFFYILSILMLAILYWSKRLAKIRRRHHEAIKSILWAVWWEQASLLFQLFHYGTYARDGIGFPNLVAVAFCMEAAHPSIPFHPTASLHPHNRRCIHPHLSSLYHLQYYNSI